MGRLRTSKVVVEGDVAVIRLGTGEAVRIDISDADWAAQFSWCRSRRADGKLAVVRTTPRGKLARLLLNAPSGTIVDHRNGDLLDNTRANIRIATITENNRNVVKRRGRCAYKGVRLCPSGNWAAYGTESGKHKHIGMFRDPESAALAYDDFARNAHGDFACVNFPQGAERGALSGKPDLSLIASHFEGINS